MNLKDMKLDSKIKLMIYGSSGSGKTVAAVTFPKPLHVCDFDGKVKSAAAYWLDKEPAMIEGVTFENYRQSEDRRVIAEFNTWLRTMREFSEEDFPYKTIVVDSLTTLAEALLREIIRENPQTNRTFPDVPAMQDYLVNKTRFTQIITNILALPCNVVVVAHVSLDKDEVTGEMMKSPLLSGKLASIIPVLFDELYHAYTLKKDDRLLYVAQTRPDNGYIARTQIPGMAEKVPLTYKSIEKAMMKKEKQNDN